jgi:putative transposase
MGTQGNRAAKLCMAQGSFAWQEGYAAFKVSATVRDAVRKYISNQEAHHRLKSFREEFVELLEKAGVEYDLRYLD